MNTSTPTVLIHARNVALDPKWVAFIEDKTPSLDRFGNGISLFEVEITHNPNRSRQPQAWRVEIAAKTLSNAIRATGQAEDPERAYWQAREILESSLRRAARRMHYSRHGRKSVQKVAPLLTE